MNKLQDVVRTKGLSNLIKLFTSSGLEPATFRLAAQCLIHYATYYDYMRYVLFHSFKFLRIEMFKHFSRISQVLQFLQELYNITAQKEAFFIVTAVKTSNVTQH
jgi:hypothetical protein